MSWLDKISGSKLLTNGRRSKSVPEGLWTKCESCQSVLYRAELERTLEVCPKCGTHRPIDARERLNHFLDPEPRFEIAANVIPTDPMKSTKQCEEHKKNRNKKEKRGCRENVVLSKLL